MSHMMRDPRWFARQRRHRISSYAISGYQAVWMATPVARALRAQPRLHHTRIIAVSGCSQPKDHANAKQAGFDRLASKPIAAASLEALLKEPPPQPRNSKESLWQSEPFVSQACWELTVGDNSSRRRTLSPQRASSVFEAVDGVEFQYLNLAILLKLCTRAKGGRARSPPALPFGVRGRRPRKSMLSAVCLSAARGDAPTC